MRASAFRDVSLRCRRPPSIRALTIPAPPSTVQTKMATCTFTRKSCVAHENFTSVHKNVQKSSNIFKPSKRYAVSPGQILHKVLYFVGCVRFALGASHSAKNSGDFVRKSTEKVRFGFFLQEYTGLTLEVVYFAFRNVPVRLKFGVPLPYFSSVDFTYVGND